MKFVGNLIAAHLKRYPQMQLADIYKLLHQAALGPAHATQDEAAARRALEDEIAAPADGPDEPMIDVISPDERLARVHLRPYVAQGLNVATLASALIETARNYPATPEKLARFCACVADFAATGAVPFSEKDTRDYFDAIALDNFPVVRHSATFHSQYKPQYRVVDKALLPL